jgi:hypothetical protein
MTAREAERIVRERYPDAVCKCTESFGGTTYKVHSRPSLGEWLGALEWTAADAWKSAARRLTGEQ